MRHLRHSRRGQGGIPPVCGADGDDVGIGRRKFDAAAQRRLRRRPPSASRRRKRIRRRAAPRAAGRHRRMRRGADLAASMPEGGAVKPRTGDGALKKVQRVRPQRKARRVPRRNGWELETGNVKLGTGGANSRTHALTNSRTPLASAAGACGRWDAPFPRGVEAPLRAHGFRSAARTGKCDTLRNPRN